MGYYAEVFRDNPDGYWRLGEGSGTSAADEVGRGVGDTNGQNPGTYVNTPTLGVAGPVGCGREGNDGVTLAAASSEHVSVGDVALFGYTGAFSVECWAKWSTAVNAGLVTKTQADGDGWGLHVGAGNQVRFWGYTDVPAAVFDLTSDDDLSDDAWHHLVGTWDGTTDAAGVKIYVDGAEVKTATAGAGAIGTGVYAMRLGGRSDGAAGTYFDGSLDECAVYTGALSAARVLAHYQAGVDGTRRDVTQDLQARIQAIRETQAALTPGRGLDQTTILVQDLPTVRFFDPDNATDVTTTYAQVL